MQGDTIEVRYYNPRAGYVTEIFPDTGPQAAINSIKARAGDDVTINTVRYHSAPPPPPFQLKRPDERR